MAEDLEEDFSDVEWRGRSDDRPRRRIALPELEPFARLREDAAWMLVTLYQLFKLARTKGDLALESHVERPSQSPYFQAANLSRAERQFVCDSLRLFTLGSADPAAMRRMQESDVSARCALLPWRRGRYRAASDAIVAHAEGYAPIVAVEIGRRSLPIWMRPSFYELEETITSAP